MQKFNYHTHTYRCKHSDQSISDEEYVRMFIEKGFKKIAFTDHCPHKQEIDFRNDMRMDYSQKEDYYNSIKNLKDKYKDCIDIEVGFEVEYLPELEEYLKQLKIETDRLILGQHFVRTHDNKGIKIIGWDKTDDEALMDYANCVEESIRKGIPDVIAHPDLFMMDRKSFGKLEKEATNIIAKAAEKYQIPLEINLSRAVAYSLGKTNRVEYPCKEFWEVVSNYNVKVIYGVDAHFRFQIDLYNEAVEVAKNVIGKDVIKKLNFVDENL